MSRARAHPGTIIFGYKGEYDVEYVRRQFLHMRRRSWWFHPASCRSVCLGAVSVLRAFPDREPVQAAQCTKWTMAVDNQNVAREIGASSPTRATATRCGCA